MNLKAFKTLVLLVGSLGSAVCQAEATQQHNYSIALSPGATSISAIENVALPSLEGLTTVDGKNWGEQQVRLVLQTFAWGGQATDRQIETWANMAPHAAIVQILNFEPVNLRLSGRAGKDPSSQYCDSLTDIQQFWGSDHPDNPMRLVNRPFYQILARNNPVVSQLNLYLAWSRLVHTPGCNMFLHKMALYITNYHASIHVQNAGPSLIRAYYDDVVQQLAQSADFVDLMNLAASHAALSRAYGHVGNHFDRQGEFNGNDDFAREYFQLLFGIQGTSEDEAYHEDVTIEHNAWLLTGMILDSQPGAWGSERRSDWLISPINFSNHFDASGRFIPNQSAHFSVDGSPSSCLEILHEQICGANAEQKLMALGPVAAAHPESMASIPLKLIRFFGDDRLDGAEIAALQAAWQDAQFDMLAFLRAYAISTQFLEGDAVKLRSAFDRNIAIHNANQLTTEEAYSELFRNGPGVRMAEQGAQVFSPIRDVFGGQTGNDAANDRFLFKSAWDVNVTNPDFLADTLEPYRLPGVDSIQYWSKDWSQVIPKDKRGWHTVSAVGEWLWNHFIGDSGTNYDAVARAQVHALLATGFDFGAIVNEQDPGVVYSSADLASGELAAFVDTLGSMNMSLGKLSGNQRVGMAVNFITALPYTFASGGE
ncbi:MAG: DUF1800 family protein [Xanthomonadales bacterium]|nr:DUF1800 family protein [Xanthomonadales bacterium]